MLHLILGLPTERGLPASSSAPVPIGLSGETGAEAAALISASLNITTGRSPGSMFS